jgi:uncharacterized membrane protein YhaH (DUF805 family)
MRFGQAIISGYRNFAVFSGRATVPEYWYLSRFIRVVNFVLVTAIVFYVFTVTSNWMDNMGAISKGEVAEVTHPPLLEGSIWLLAAIPFLVQFPLFACGVRRLHDTGRAGWNLFLPAAVGLTILTTLYILFVPREVPPFQAFLLLFTPIWFFEPRLLLGLAAFVAVMLFFQRNLHRKLREPSQPSLNPYGPPPSEVTP